MCLAWGVQFCGGHPCCASSSNAMGLVRLTTRFSVHPMFKNLTKTSVLICQRQLSHSPSPQGEGALCPEPRVHWSVSARHGQQRGQQQWPAADPHRGSPAAPLVGTGEPEKDDSVEGARGCRAEWSQSVQEDNPRCSHAYVEFKKQNSAS